MAFPGILLTHQLDGTHHRAGLGNGVYGFGGLHSEALRDTHGIWSVRSCSGAVLEQSSCRVGVAQDEVDNGSSPPEDTMGPSPDGVASAASVSDARRMKDRWMDAPRAGCNAVLTSRPAPLNASPIPSPHDRHMPCDSFRRQGLVAPAPDEPTLAATVPAATPASQHAQPFPSSRGVAQTAERERELGTAQVRAASCRMRQQAPSMQASTATPKEEWEQEELQRGEGAPSAGATGDWRLGTGVRRVDGVGRRYPETREAGLELGSAVGLLATLIVKSQGRYEEAHGADECMDEGEERDEKAGPYKRTDPRFPAGIALLSAKEHADKPRQGSKAHQQAPRPSQLERSLIAADYKITTTYLIPVTCGRNGSTPLAQNLNSVGLALFPPTNSTIFRPVFSVRSELRRRLSLVYTRPVFRLTRRPFLRRRPRASLTRRHQASDDTSPAIHLNIATAEPKLASAATTPPTPTTRRQHHATGDGGGAESCPARHCAGKSLSRLSATLLWTSRAVATIPSTPPIMQWWMVVGLGTRSASRATLPIPLHSSSRPLSTRSGPHWHTPMRSVTLRRPGDIGGSGGGPQESNTTAFLVRAASHNWSKSSLVAVDAGVHLSAITRLLRDALTSSPPTSFPHTLTSGPFAGLSLPFTSPEANAAHITRALVDTYLFTHPHLDHIAGFVINTAGLPGTRPKKIAGLPSTIHAFKTHIFNNVIWPNLSDENNGAGLLTYLRLVEGGSPALGDGEAKGYLEVCDGLLVKTWSVSHGHCIERHSHRGSSASSASPRFGSHDASSQASRRDGHPLYAFNHHAQSYYPPSAPSSQPLTRSQTLLGQAAFGLGGASPQASPDVQERYCVYDSSAYFIQDADHRREVLIFGDVEPDSISLNPRNLGIWQEAAPKVAAGTMAAIFIECSYDDSQSNDRLYGHLKPVFVIEELAVLAAETEMARRLQSLESRKRKRMASISDEPGGRPNPGRVTSSLSSTSTPAEEPVSPKSVKPAPVTPAVRAFEAASPDTPHLATPTDELSLREAEELDNGAGVPPRRPLEGLKVVIIHVKERLTDGPDVGETILRQLREHEQEARLGCEFIVSKPGQSFYF
ncbi:hypothetical protein PCL_02499 [Purpureocillium lilacinum]|uniref:Cyclic-AMP phosphodiesterase, class-II n=1 Tax=Purpureocillium lilacinum TaxID=33203 RepID=A0A2U3E0Q9_PURLI|nr:hypothetical protein PCL_02499 [Purpureocillium lilacinum]